MQPFALDDAECMIDRWLVLGQRADKEKKEEKGKKARGAATMTKYDLGTVPLPVLG